MASYNLIYSGNQNIVNYTSTAIVTLGATVIPLNTVSGLTVGRVLNAPGFLAPNTIITNIVGLSVTIGTPTILTAPLGTTFYTTNPVITVPDGSIYSIGNVVLPGRNFNGYGQPVDQSMLSMVENWASAEFGPSLPVTGQLWYDANAFGTANGTMKFNTSSNSTTEWALIPKMDTSGNATFGNITVNPPGKIYGNLEGSLSNGTSSVSIPTINGNVLIAVGGTNRLTVGTGGANITGILTTSVAIQTPVLTTGANTTAGTITGNWTLSAGSRLNATYADLAERHHSDRQYQLGTVMKVGGINEVTSASVGDIAIGVISDQYAYLMNGTAGPDSTHPAIAYVGRVRVRVIGPVKKHDRMVPTIDGCARASPADNYIGWALETNTDEAEKLVLCIIK